MSRATKSGRRLQRRSPSADSPLLGAPSISPRLFRRRWTLGRIGVVILLLSVAGRFGWTAWRDVQREPDFQALAAGRGRIASVRDDGSLDWQPDRGARHADPPTVRVKLLSVRYDQVGRRAVPHQRAVDWLRTHASQRPASLLLDRRRVDATGCWLAWVQIDDRLLNEQLVASGWAACDDCAGDAPALRRRLQQAEKSARQARRGWWNRRETELVGARGQG